MTRDDLYGYYKRWYAPNNAALVIVGDVDPEDVLRRVEKYFSPIRAASLPGRLVTLEPNQLGERRVSVERPGTTAYLKLAWRAPEVTSEDFAPMLVLDAALSGAKGVNIWASFRNPPQRSTRLYRALVETGLAASVFGALLPTEHPFLYSVSCTVTDGIATATLEAALLEALGRVVRDGLLPEEVARAKHQLRARFVFEADSITNIAHQLGYFHTVASLEVLTAMPVRIAAVTLEDVARVAAKYLRGTSCTVGTFKPVVGADPS